MIVFYARVSTEDQNEARQMDMAEKVSADHIYLDKMSGTRADRPQLRSMLDYIREGDVVYVESISRLSRSTEDLLKIVGSITEKGALLVSMKENLDTRTPQGRFVLTLFGALAELERENIRQRQAEGIAEAKKRGVYKGRPPADIDRKKFEKMCRAWRAGYMTARDIQKQFSISAPTFYKKVKEWEL